MITVIFPEWMAWLIVLSMTLYVINCALDLLAWRLKRKLKQLKEGSNEHTQNK